MISGHPVFCRVKRPGLGSALKKLEFGEPQASGILSPAYWRGGKFNSPGRKPWGKVKIVTEPQAE